jgi:phenylalanyl-tRNA synthetase beta chain
MDRELPALRVENPMRAEENLLRRSLLGTLLRVARGNANRGNTDLRLFEIAPVYVRRAAEEDSEEMLLGAALLHGDFHRAKGCATAILEAVGLADEVEYVRGAPAPFTLCRAATLLCSGATVGHVIELSRAVRERFGLSEDTSLFELRVDVLSRSARLDRTCAPVSRHPAIERDLDLVVPESVRWSELARCVSDGASGLLESLRPFDVFRSEKLGTDRKSVTLRLLLRSIDRTLTAGEADACVARILELVRTRTGGSLRA